MSILSILVSLLLICLVLCILWAIVRYLPLPPPLEPVRNFGYVLVLIVALLMVLDMAGALGAPHFMIRIR